MYTTVFDFVSPKSCTALKPYGRIVQCNQKNILKESISSRLTGEFSPFILRTVIEKGRDILNSL